MPTATSAIERLTRGPLALALFVIAWGWLSLRADAPIHSDSSRDLAFARELVEGSVLHRHGAWTSFAGFEQGTTWIHVLALLELFGLGIVGIERALTTLLAASVALTYLGARRLLPASEHSWRAALVGALLLLAGLPLACEMPLLWQPLLLPVVIVPAHLALWRLLRDGELLDALALAVLSALALDIHVVSVAFGLMAVVALPLASKRPLASVSLAALLGCATLLASSWQAVHDNLLNMQARGLLWPSVLALGVAMLSGALARRRFLALEPEARVRLGVGLELGVLAAVVAASLLDATPSLAGRYLAPFLPAPALAAGLLVARARSRRSATLSILLAIGVCLLGFESLRPPASRELPSHPRWTIVGFQAIAARLHADGHTWTELVASLQGPERDNLLGYLSSVVEPGSGEPAPPREGLLVLALSPRDADEVVAQVEREQQLMRISLPEFDALLLRTSARVNRHAAQLCRDADDCHEVFMALTNRVYESQYTAWIDRAPASEWLTQDGRPPPEQLLWKLPLQPGPAASLVIHTWPRDRCHWRFVAVAGFVSSTTLPSRSIEVPEHASGNVWVSRPREDGCSEYTVLPPSISELAPTWTRLLERL